MLSMTTKRHCLFITIAGVRGCSADDFSGLGAAVDNAVDVLEAKCRQDPDVMAKLGDVSTREDAYRVIARHLRAATPDAKWMRDAAGSDLCRRVLYLLHPDRFGFQTYGWVH